MTNSVEIHGQTDKRFERVREAFASGFERGVELGASLAIEIDGKRVVDLWAGSADRHSSSPWQADTLVNVYSTTKGITALCAHRLVDEGRLDLDAPVVKYWPEFGQAGKDRIPVRQLLNHRAGLPALRTIRPGEALFDWNTMTAALAAETPWWTPGEKHGYHAVTFGWLVGELIRRVTGKSVGTYLREEVAGPLGADFHIGLGPELQARAARLTQMKPSEVTPEYKTGQPNIVEVIMKDPAGVTSRAFANPPTMAKPGVANTPEWRAAEIPAANGHASARGLAALYSAAATGKTVGGRPFLSAASLMECHTEGSHGTDEVLKISSRFGSGFMLCQDFKGGSFSPNPRSFGHPGAGGSLGYADLDAKIGFGYVMNRMGVSLIIDPRPQLITQALYESL